MENSGLLENSRSPESFLRLSGYCAAAISFFQDPVAVESILADAGLDIGEMLIGMRLKRVAVPLRLETKQIGEAMLLAARTLPRFIGGVRARYNEELL